MLLGLCDLVLPKPCHSYYLFVRKAAALEYAGGLDGSPDIWFVPQNALRKTIGFVIAQVSPKPAPLKGKGGGRRRTTKFDKALNATRHVKDGLRIRKAIASQTKIVLYAAPLVLRRASHPRSKGIVVYVTHRTGESLAILNGLAPIGLPKDATRSTYFVCIVARTVFVNIFERLREVPLGILDGKVYMVAHKTVGVNQ